MRAALFCFFGLDLVIAVIIMIRQARSKHFCSGPAKEHSLKLAICAYWVVVRPTSVGGSGGMPPRNFWDLGAVRCVLRPSQCK